MIKIRTRPINTSPPSSMRAALNSGYCMKAQLLARSFGNGKEGFFSYQEGQHAVNGNGKGKTGQGRTVVPPEVKVIPTPTGKRWFTPAMEVELRGDVLEIRDGFGNIIDAVVLKRF